MMTREKEIEEMVNDFFKKPEPEPDPELPPRPEGYTKPERKSFGRWNDLSIMSFGKYKGRTLASIPDSYLRWLATEATSANGDLIAYCQYRLGNTK